MEQQALSMGEKSYLPERKSRSEAEIPGPVSLAQRLYPDGR